MFHANAAAEKGKFNIRNRILNCVKLMRRILFFTSEAAAYGFCKLIFVGTLEVAQMYIPLHAALASSYIAAKQHKTL